MKNHASLGKSLILVLIAALTSVASADDRSKLQKISALLTDIPIISAAKYRTIDLARQALLRDKRIPKEQKAKLQDQFKAAIAENSVRDVVLEHWASHFTEQEIDQILTFYRSPAGIKFFSLRQTINREVIPGLEDLAKEEYRKITHLNFPERTRSDPGAQAPGDASFFHKAGS